jgi:hypothetical protein
VLIKERDLVLTEEPEELQTLVEEDGEMATPKTDNNNDETSIMYNDDLP